jgi:hypothetical protein
MKRSPGGGDQRRLGRTSASSGRSSHTAQYQGLQITVHYRHHPLAGSRLVVEYAVRSGAGLFLIVPRPNGRVLAIPSWMTESWAGDLPTCTLPSLALAALQDLRRLLDDVLSSPPAQSVGDGDHDGDLKQSADPVRLCDDTYDTVTSAGGGGDVDGGTALAGSSERDHGRRSGHASRRRSG